MVNNRVLLFSLLAGSLLAQPGGVAGFGYRLPSNAIQAAPGQVLTISVLGIQRRLAGPIQPETGVAGLATEVEGLALRLRQRDASTLLPIRYVQQSRCPATGACSPVTTFTVQLPDTLEAEAAAGIEFLERQSVVAAADLRVVTDDVHVMSTCDQTGAWFSVAVDVVPAGVCAPIITHARGGLVTPSNPAQPGETLVMWAFGLGALDRPYVPTPNVEDLPLAIQPFSIGFSYPGATRTAYKRLTQTVPTYVGMVGGGFYQAHFVVPAAPASLPECDGFRGNVRLMLSGPASSDTAEICVAK